MEASVARRRREAAAILDPHPNIASHSIYAAAVLGDVGAVGNILTASPSAAVDTDEGRGWPALLYACYSRWHQIDPSRATGMAEVLRLLLTVGASRTRTTVGAARTVRSGAARLHPEGAADWTHAWGHSPATRPRSAAMRAGTGAAGS